MDDVHWPTQLGHGIELKRTSVVVDGTWYDKSRTVPSGTVFEQSPSPMSTHSARSLSIASISLSSNAVRGKNRGS